MRAVSINYDILFIRRDRKRFPSFKHMKTDSLAVGGAFRRYFPCLKNSDGAIASVNREDVNRC